MELIKIEEREGKETVSARDLHKFLENGRDFSHWIVDRIGKYDFIKDEDFTIIQTKSNGGRPSKEYYLSLDMAKELSMVERNSKGKEARAYFIACEKKSLDLVQEMSPIEMMAKQAQLMLENEKKMIAVESRLDHIEAKQITSEVNYFTVSGYCSLNRIQASQIQAADLGRKCAKLSRQKGIRVESVPDARYGRVNTYSIEVLKEIVC